MYNKDITELLVNICNASTDITSAVDQIQELLSKTIVGDNQQIFDYIAKRTAIRDSLHHWQFNYIVLGICMGFPIQHDSVHRTLNIYSCISKGVLLHRLHYGAAACAMCAYARKHYDGYDGKREPCGACPYSPHTKCCNNRKSPWAVFSEICSHYSTVTPPIISAANEMVQWVEAAEDYLTNVSVVHPLEVINNIFPASK